jgi:hypothetical protein
MCLHTHRAQLAHLEHVGCSTELFEDFEHGVSSAIDPLPLLNTRPEEEDEVLFGA